MQTKNLYAIRDIKTDLYDSPFDAPNDATAKRFFTRVLSSVPLMSEHPEDFSLHSVGAYNSHTAEIVPSTVQFIASGLECIKNIQQEMDDEKTQVSDESPIQSST